MYTQLSRTRGGLVNAGNRFNALKPRLFNATQRHGVEIDVLWGEDEEKTATRATRTAVSRYEPQVRRGGTTDRSASDNSGSV
jgi:hypothetical protein